LRRVRRDKIQEHRVFESFVARVSPDLSKECAGLVVNIAPARLPQGRGVDRGRWA
jgi:hypothetical protein